MTALLRAQCGSYGVGRGLVTRRDHVDNRRENRIGGTNAERRNRREGRRHPDVRTRTRRDAADARRRRSRLGTVPDRRLVSTRGVGNQFRTPTTPIEFLFVVKSCFVRVDVAVGGASWSLLRGASYARCGSGSGCSQELAVGV